MAHRESTDLCARPRPSADLPGLAPERGATRCGTAIAPSCSVAPPWEAVLTEAQVHSIGWLAWSWSPGNSCPGLDMSSSGTFAGIKTGWPAAVTTTHAGSIAKTSKPISSLAGVCP